MITLRQTNESRCDIPKRNKIYIVRNQYMRAHTLYSYHTNDIDRGIEVMTMGIYFKFSCHLWNIQFATYQTVHCFAKFRERKKLQAAQMLEEPAGSWWLCICSRPVDAINITECQSVDLWSLLTEASEFHIGCSLNNKFIAHQTKLIS